MTATGDVDRAIALALRSSRTTAVLGTLWCTLKKRFREAFHSGIVGRAAATTHERLPEAWANASISSHIAGRHSQMRESVPSASITALAGSLLLWIRASWIYRWLTAEPDPDVIVIDLRETLSVGPVIAAMDRTLRWFVPAAATAVVVRLTVYLATVARSRPIRLGSRCLGLVVAVGVTLLALTGGLNEITLGLALVLGALAIAGLPSRASFEDIQNHPVTRALVAALEPPEPPDSGAE
jgi:hypothetical protein